jgi:hypothetical protein
MASSVYHAAHHLPHLLTSHFLLVWLLVLILVLVCGLLVSDPRHPIFSSISPKKVPVGRKRFPWRPTLTDGITAIAFALFVMLYVMAIFYKEDFAYYDNDQLTDYSVQGTSFPPPIWPNAGRFFPLGLQEFNVLSIFTKSPAGFHSFAVAQLMILILALLAVLNEYKIIYRTLILMAAMVAPSFVISFTGLIYTERNILFWLAIIVLCLYGHSKTKDAVYFVGCLVATHFALYYKETVVIFVVAYAGTRLLLESHFGRRAGRPWKELARENSLALGMLAVSGIYAALFLVTMLPHRNLSYVVEHREALSSVLLTYMQTDWMPAILLAVFLFRIQRWVFSGDELDPLWESLAVGALAYFFAVIALGLVSGYYLAPVDLIALLYVARVSLAWLSKPTRARFAVVAIAFVCILLHNAAYSSFRIVERKTVIRNMSEFSEFLKRYLPTSNNSSVELFFPHANGYRLMELSAYLKYKGFRLVGQTVTVPDPGPHLVVEGRESFTNYRCVDYRDYACIHVESAAAGALVIVLPDDQVSMNDVENIGKDREPLLSLKAPGIFTRKWFRSLHAISPEFSTSQLPEHWLRLDVFKTVLPPSISTLRQPTVPWTSSQGAPSPWAR